MSGKSVSFGDEKIKKSKFYKNKRAFKIYHIYHIDINKILVSKDEPYGLKSQLNISLDIMIMMTLDLYA